MYYTYESLESRASRPSEGICPSRKLFETLLQKKINIVSNIDTQIYIGLQNKTRKLEISNSQFSKLFQLPK